MKAVQAVEVSDRVVIRPGDRIRARGGPTYKGKRIGHPGIYLVRDLFKRRHKIHANATKLDKQGLPCGIYTLFVQGKPYRSKVLDTIVNRPYRVSKVRS